MGERRTEDGQWWDEAKARRSLGELARTGESIAQFARRRGISAQWVYYWKKRLAETRAPAFVAVPLGLARDGQIEIIVDGVESGLRTWVLNRKTWLFVGHEPSARRTADALTLLTTCKKMGIHPRAYLRDTLAKILAGEKNLAALLPETYAAAHARAAPAAHAA